MRDSSGSAITVVIPVYDDWTSLEKCIASVIEHVDTTVHKVLLVNDVGPHADTLEGLIRFAIQGRAGFEYHRNDQNLGFVATCNRAVFELDKSGNDILLLNSDAELTAGAFEEMHAVLYLAEHHAVVCPRSNNATIASLPFFRRRGDASEAVHPERTRELVSAILPELPRFYLSPVAIGFCFMVRRSIIDNLGLFDPVFGAGYNEENDFCLRINALGYSSLIANHAFVWHQGSASFGASKAELQRTNHALLESRYPFYMPSVYAFIAEAYSAIDVFADVIVPGPGNQRSVLIDIHHLSLVQNGSTRFALSFLEVFTRMKLPAGVDVTITAQNDAIRFFSLEKYGFAVMPYPELEGVYDIGVAIAPINNIDQLVHLNRHCARWVTTHFDMIAARSFALQSLDPLRTLIIEKGLQYADRVVSISEASLDDAKAYFPNLQPELAAHGESAMLGSTREIFDTTVDADGGESVVPKDIAAFIANGDYLVVMGNFYPHKQIAQALAALDGLDLPLVVFGPVQGHVAKDTTLVVAGGTLSEHVLNQILGNAALVLFPSAYEGFGFPMADAVDFGVPVIAFNSAVTREVMKKLRLGSAVRTFDRFSELPALVIEARSDVALHDAASARRDRVRDLKPFGRRLMEIVFEELAKPLDTAALERRFRDVNAVERITINYGGRLSAEQRRTAEILASRSYTVGRQIATIASPVMRVARRIRRPAR